MDLIQVTSYEPILHGRNVLYTDYEKVDRSNVVDCLKKIWNKHMQNRSDIQYLWDYYRNIHPIATRTKEVRPEITVNTAVSHATEIVDFKSGYLVGEPIQYVNRGITEDASEAINELNGFMFAEDKASKDKELSDWMHVCGTGYRMVYPNQDEAADEDDAPYRIYTLDPRTTGVVYWSGLGHKPVLSFSWVLTEEHGAILSAYTDNAYYELVGWNIVKEEYHYINHLPIVEYPLNNARMGAFEPVLPLLDALDRVTTDRLEATEMFVQALMVFQGVDIDSNDFAALRQQGAIKVPVEGDVKYLISELNQAETQTLVDHLYHTILTICGMPTVAESGTSDSSNNGAVILKNGWQGAEARAKDAEMHFKRAERQVLKVVISICDVLGKLSLRLPDIDIRFTRRNYEDIGSKSTVLTQLLGCDKVHPRLAFEHCGLFPDPEVAYTMSEEYAKEQEKKAMEMLSRQDESDADSDTTNEDTDNKEKAVDETTDSED